jgi:hypothetical protein
MPSNPSVSTEFYRLIAIRCFAGISNAAGRGSLQREKRENVAYCDANTQMQERFSSFPSSKEIRARRRVIKS